MRTSAAAAPARAPLPSERTISTRSIATLPSSTASEPNTTTAMIAPIGSIRMPSHLRTFRTWDDGLMKSRIGSTTVGPETIRTAPIRTEIGWGRSNSQTIASVAITQVSRTPMVQSRTTADRTPAPSSSRFRLRAPSKRIRPTAIWTAGESASPSSFSGSIRPVTEVPATTPMTSSGTIAGTRMTVATRRARTDSTTTRLNPRRMSSISSLPSSPRRSPDSSRAARGALRGEWFRSGASRR